MYYLVQHKDGPIKIVSSEERPDISGGGFCSGGYETELELRKGQGVLDTPCQSCGGLIKANYYGKEELIERRLCFTCNYWFNITLERAKHVIIDGVCYSIAPDDNSGAMQGFGGREFKIQFLDDDRVVITHNLWFQGPVPKQFREKLPNTARFYERK